jgi:hypothetical protein
MKAGKPNRLVLTVALFLLVAANALVVAGHSLYGTHPEAGQTQIALQSSQRALLSRTPLRIGSQSSPEQSAFTVPALRAHWPTADFSGWLQLSQAPGRILASGFESPGGRAPPRFL